MNNKKNNLLNWDLSPLLNPLLKLFILNIMNHDLNVSESYCFPIKDAVPLSSRKI